MKKTKVVSERFLKRASVSCVFDIFGRRHPIYATRTGYVCVTRKTREVVASDKKLRHCEFQARLVLAERASLEQGKRTGAPCIFKCRESRLGLSGWLPGVVAEISITARPHSRGFGYEVFATIDPKYASQFRLPEGPHLVAGIRLCKTQSEAQEVATRLVGLEVAVSLAGDNLRREYDRTTEFTPFAGQ